MTAEVLVMNKHGVALAADSVIATHTGTITKIFSGINKLFRLSPSHQVAIMIYEAVEFMHIPWETLISEFRARLGKRTHPTVEDYAADFISYLKELQTSETERESVFLESMTIHFWDIADEIKTGFTMRESGEPFCDATLQTWAQSKLESLETALNRKQVLPEFSDINASEFVWRYRRLINQARNRGFFANINVAPTRSVKRTLLRLAYLFAVKDTFCSFSSGLVFAGFGQAQLMPSVRAYRLEAMLPDQFKLRLDTKRDVTTSNQGIIIPFAQSEMVYRFLQGVDKDYDSYVFTLLSKLASEISSFVIDQHVPEAARDSARQQAESILQDKFDAISAAARSFRRENFANPVIEAVKSLPKQELAALAEALVQLTSLRRKMSIDVETVGEPIDVALISKPDGFVWIKRKLYYDPVLNESLNHGT